MVEMLSLVLLIVSGIGFSIMMFFRAVENNIFFTEVHQGTEKQVVRWGKWVRTLKPGFNWVGIWPIWKVYTYQFGWTGVQKDGTFEEHPKRWIDYILTKEDVYALKVLDAEDKNLVPCEWLITMTVKVVNSRKALFRIENWLEALFNRIGPYVRDFSTLHTYEELIQGKEGKTKLVLEKAIFERLETEKILEKFQKSYGVHIRALEVVDIDPDIHFRKLTLQKRKGQANRAQALAETSDRIVRGVAKRAGMKLKDFLEDIKAHPNKKGLPIAGGGYADYYREENDIVKRDRAGAVGELRDVRVGNSDGTPFGSSDNSGQGKVSQTISEVVGGVIAAATASYFGAAADAQQNKGKPGKPNRRKKDDDDDDDEEVKAKPKDEEEK